MTAVVLPDLDAQLRDEQAPPCDSKPCSLPGTWAVRMLCPTCGRVTHLQCDPCMQRIHSARQHQGVRWKHTPCGTWNAEITGWERL